MKKSAQKYFIYHLKRLAANENKILVYKMDANLKEVLIGYLESYDNLIKAGKTLDNGTFITYIEILKNSLKNSSFKNNKSLSVEFKMVIEKINRISNIKTGDEGDVKNIEVEPETKDAREKEMIKSFTELYKMCTVLIKKLNRIDLIEHLIDEALKGKNYDEIEKIAIELLNELIYKGYSLYYLKEYLGNLIKSREIDEKSIEDTICELKQLNKDSVKFKLYIALYNKEGFIIDEGLSYLKEVKDSEEVTSKFNKISKNYSIFEVEENGMDIYKVGEEVSEKLTNYFHLKQLLNRESIKSGLYMNKFYYTKNSDIEEGYFDNNDYSILFNKLNKREEADLKDFLEYRKIMDSFSQPNEEIHIMQRILNVSKNFEKVTKENGLINQWSSLESILMYKNDEIFNKIVPKINSVLPKIIILYLIKDRINLFWHTLLSLNNDISKLIIKKCSNDGKKYELSLVIDFIRDFKKLDKESIKEIQQNDVLYREISSIGMLIDDKIKRKDYFEKIKNRIELDISYIYRVRNLLVHSGIYPKTHFHFKTLRLNNYNNRILGVIIHYKKNNPKVTIEEIFTSLTMTYNKYMEEIEKEEIELEYLCRPNYLFL